MPPTKRKSLIWNYFDILGNEGKKATCKMCKKSLAYSAATMSNLNRHLKAAHSVTAVTEQETPLEIFTVQAVESHCGNSENSPLKSYEISLKNFDDLGEDLQDQEQDSQNDPDWTPENAADSKPGTSFTLGPPEPKKEKSLGRRSFVWDHFQRSPCKSQGMCLHCGKVIKLGTISNLSRHLRQRHPTTAIIRQKTDATMKQEDVLEEPYDQDLSFPRLKSNGNVSTEFVEVSVDDLNNPISVIETRVNENKRLMDVPDFDYTNASESNATQASQTEFLDEGDEFDINDFLRPKKRAVVAEQVDRELVKMIVKGCHLINIVEQPSFKEFVSLLNPKYVLPTANKIALELVPEYYQEYEKKTTKSLKAAEGVCLHVDEWLSKMKTYLCITAHIINAECEFEAIFLSCHIISKTEETPDVSDRLLETIKDWEVSHKVVAVVTESGSIAPAAVHSLHLPQIPNFMKTLSLVVHESLQAIKNTVFKIQSFIDEIVKVPNLLAEVYTMQKLLKLPQVKLITKVKNHWSSSFMFVEMLARCEKLKKAISQVQNNHPEFQPKIIEGEWKYLTNIVEVLNIFKAVKKEVLEEDRVTLSKVVFYLKALKRELNKAKCSRTNDAVYLATVLEMNLNKEFEGIEKADFSTNVLLLDPRLKKHAFDDESEYAEACSKLKKEVCEVVLAEPQYPESQANTLWYSFDNEVRKINAVKDPIGKGILELENYLQEQLLSRKEDPLSWWNQRRAVYPRLFKLARKYLCVTFKAAASESISYKSAYMLSQLRHNGLSHTESEIMFLHHNM